ncbi:DUF2617 family protein [Micromonospora sonneratiae]|uniref:DUF2617 family protein n=1 Tax=Micromonospora sonneratiae TaxID=1184706 RepID=A0ABW3YD38_9ACTN
MLVTLDAPYADTSAADLSFALESAERPALYVLDLVLPTTTSADPAGSQPSDPAGSQPSGDDGVRLRLRLLGASHQVTVSASGLDFVETVACLPGRQPDLPATVEDAATGYRFTARVLRLNSAELAARSAALRQELADDPYALVGVFPGGPDAITALQAGVHAGAGIGWRTWHAYPQTGELVETETTVRMR